MQIPIVQEDTPMIAIVARRHTSPLLNEYLRANDSHHGQTATALLSVMLLRLLSSQVRREEFEAEVSFGTIPVRRGASWPAM